MSNQRILFGRYYQVDDLPLIGLPVCPETIEGPLADHARTLSGTAFMEFVFGKSSKTDHDTTLNET